MEKYSRLTQFFSSPDKTLRELYPFSPNASNKPLSKCSIPADVLSISSSDEDISGSDLSESPVSSGSESPIRRKLLFAEPPSRLHLKRRTAKKTQQSGKEDGRKPSFEVGQPAVNVRQWRTDTQTWKDTTSVVEGRTERVEDTSRDRELPPRPPSRRKGSGDTGRRRLQDRESPDRSSSNSGSMQNKSNQDRVRQNRSTQVRSNQNRSNEDRNSPGRSSSDGIRKRRHSPETTKVNEEPQNRRVNTEEQCTALTTHYNAWEVLHQTITQEPHRSTPRIHRSPEHNTEDAHSNRTQSPHQRTPATQRTRDVPYRVAYSDHRNTNEVIFRSTIESLYDTSYYSVQIKTDPPCESKAAHHQERDINQQSFDLTSQSEAAARPASGAFRRQNGESPSRNTTETSSSPASVLTRERRYRTPNFTLPSGPTKLSTNLTQKSDSVSSPRSQERRTDVFANSSRDNSPNGLSTATARRSAQSPSRSFAGQSEALPSKPPGISPIGHRDTQSLESLRSSPESPATFSVEESVLSPTRSPERSLGRSPQDTSRTSPQYVQKYVLVSSATSFAPVYHQDGISQSQSKSEEEPNLVLERKPMIELKLPSEDKLNKAHVKCPNRLEEQKSTSTQARRMIHEKTENEIGTFLRRVQNSSEKKSSSSMRTTPPIIQGHNAMEDVTQIYSCPKNSGRLQRQSHVLQEEIVKADIPSTRSEKVFAQSNVKVGPTAEHIATISPNCSVHQVVSCKSCTGSDVTDGDSVLDMEKFKQTIRSAEMPPELLEPLETSDESNNRLNILETISESPLEDCSENQNSSNYEDDEHGSTDTSVVTVCDRAQRGSTQGEHIVTDLSDIQLHYAYGRTKNDQLELQWIKLEKVADTGSESSGTSLIESPFQQYENSLDLQIRSVNLPNASTAPRHGDADRGPIATYLTLPTQSPASHEDPELAIIVLHEDNLSEQQKQVINRLRTGMKRRRSRSSSEMIYDVLGNQLSHEQNDQPLVIPISDPNSEAGSTSGFAVIADSEREAPLSVDVDVKSWFSKQDFEDLPLIRINKCPSKCLQDFSNPSYSMSRLLHENKEYEHHSASTVCNTRKSIREDRRQVSSSGTVHPKGDSSQYTTGRSELVKGFTPGRPNTAPPRIEDDKSRRGPISHDQRSADKNTPQLTFRVRKRSEKSENLQRGSSRSPTIHAGTAQKTSVALNERSCKSPSSEKSTENELPETPVGDEHGALNKQDNTVQVLLQPKSKAIWASQEESRNIGSYSCNHISDNLSKYPDVQSGSSGQKTSNRTSKNCQDKSPSTERPKSSERPRTASPVSEEPWQTSKFSQKYSQKRSLSASGRMTSEQQNTSIEVRDVESHAPGQRETVARNSRKNSNATKTQSKQREKSPSVRSSGTIDVTYESCESSATTDSATRYRLRRNISYFSEFRKTIDSLHSKCVMKDHMIDALLEELQRLAPPDDTYERLLVKLSNRKAGGPPPRCDYSCSDVAVLLPRDRGLSHVDTYLSPLSARVAVDKGCEGQCVCPSDFRIAGRVGCDCLLLIWKSAQENNTVAGYEVEVDGQLSQRVRSAARTSALVMDLDLSREMRFSLRTLRTGGMSPCHEPLNVVYAPSGDDWVLEDPRPLSPSS